MREQLNHLWFLKHISDLTSMILHSLSTSNRSIAHGGQSAELRNVQTESVEVLNCRSQQHVHALSTLFRVSDLILTASNCHLLRLNCRETLSVSDSPKSCRRQVSQSSCTGVPARGLTIPPVGGAPPSTFPAGPGASCVRNSRCNMRVR